MYIRNIIEAIKDLNNEEELLICFRSGKTSRVFKTDKYHNENGDLKIIRNLKLSRCIIYIDCAEVESIVIRKRSDDL